MQKKNYNAPQTELITLVTEPIMGNATPGTDVSEDPEQFRKGDAGSRGHNSLWDDDED